MSKQNQLQMPGVFGGLMRYDEEYSSRFMISPVQVIFMIIAIIAFVLILKFMFPIAAPTVASTLLPLILNKRYK